MKSFLFSALLGFLALAAVNFTAPYTGLALPVSVLSLAAAGGLGLPGVVLTLALNVCLL